MPAYLGTTKAITEREYGPAIPLEKPLSFLALPSTPINGQAHAKQSQQPKPKGYF